MLKGFRLGLGAACVGGARNSLQDGIGYVRITQFNEPTAGEFEKALAKLNVDPMRVFTRSYGKDKPVDTGHDDAAWQKNRRDDFVLLRP